MGPTIFMGVYTLYMTSHPRFMTSQPSIQLFSLLYLIWNWIYLTTHALHLCIHTQIIDHVTPIVCMITEAQYAWYHVNTYDITSTFYDITKRYDIHIHCIQVITPRIPVIASTVAELLLTVYWLEHVCNMCDMKPLYVWHMNSMWYHNHYYWHQKTVFMTSHPQCSWIQSHCIRHDIHYTCDITATVTMTRHLQYFWHGTQCIWDLNRWMNGNTMTVSVMIPNVSV